MVQMNRFTRQNSDTDVENKHMDAKGGKLAEGRGMDWEFGVGRCKLQHLE